MFISDVSWSCLVKMEFVNVLDDKGRFVRLECYDNGNYRQIDSHTVSYLYMRDQFKMLGDTMGLEIKVVEEDK